MEKALSGVRVLGATRMLAGPFAEMLLADMGAEVLHIELPGRGDDSRHFNPLLNGVGTCYLCVNRNKKSISLNLGKPEGQQIFRDLAKISDVVIENNRPGTMDKWNIGYEQLKDINPGLVMASISGYGQTGPYSSWPGLDIVAQARGGVMSFNGAKGGPPTRTGNVIGDFLGGLFAVYGILSALHYKQRTGKGQYIDAALVDSVAATLENAITNYSAMGIVLEPIGSRTIDVAPYNTFSTKEGKYVVVGVNNNTLWQRLANVIGRPDLAEHPEFANAPDRVKNVDEVERVVQEWIGQHTAEEAVDMLNKAGVVCGKVNNIADVVNDDYLLSRDMIVEIDDPAVGKYKVAGVTPKLSLTPGSVETPPPTVGQHNDEIYRGLLHISDEKMKALSAAGVI